MGRALLYNPNDACLDADPTSRNGRHARARPARHRARSPLPRRRAARRRRRAVRAAAPQPGDSRAVGPARIADPARPDRSPRHLRRPQRLQHAAAPGARPRRRLLRQRHRAARRRRRRHVRSARLRDRGGRQVRAARARLVQHQPGGEHGDAADEPHARRQRAPGVADGAAADRGRPGEARAAPSALRAAAGRVDAAQRRRRRGPVCLAGDAGRRPVRRARRQRHRHALPRVGRPSRLHPLSVEPVRPQPGVAARLPRVDAARAAARPIGSVSTIALRRDPLVYADAFPERWAAFRRLRLAISWPASAARSIGPGPTRSSRPR